MYSSAAASVSIIHREIRSVLSNKNILWLFIMCCCTREHLSSIAKHTMQIAPLLCKLPTKVLRTCFSSRTLLHWVWMRQSHYDFLILSFRESTNIERCASMNYNIHHILYHSPSDQGHIITQLIYYYLQPNCPWAKQSTACNVQWAVNHW